PDNADPSKAYLNEELIRLDSQNYEEAFQEKMKEHGITARHDNVKMLKIMMTYSGDEGEIDKEEWKKKSVEWVQNYFGKDNVVSAVYHGDESSPHIHAAVIPIVDGRLYASEYINGKAKCANMQSSYAEAVKDAGLERGMESSPVSYQTMQKLRVATEKVASENLPSPMRDESLESYYARANEHYKEERLRNYRKQTEIFVQSAKEVESFKRAAQDAEKSKEEAYKSVKPLVIRNQELEKELRQKEKELSELQAEFSNYLKKDGLTPVDMKRLQNLNKVFSALKQGLLGEDNDKKKDIMLAIMNEAVSAYSNADRNCGSRLDDREFDFEEESDKEQV
ncbi:MAG: MobV family relaxase, partial [Acutalibacteraceae bacterium]